MCDRNLETNRNYFLKNYLLENYSKKSKIEIIEELNLSWGYIQRIAHYFNIKRDFNDSPRTLIKLLDTKDNISCYWLGFLLADGHISKQNTIIVNLSVKDKEYFERIKEHINIKLKPYYVSSTNSVRFLLCDRQSIVELKKMFNWKTNKTKEIPILPKLNNEQLFSLIIGFIDGDGTISKKGNLIRIKCDKSWKEILEFFYNILTNDSKDFKLTSDNLSNVYINKQSLIRDIKNRALSLNLPIMKRKWDRVVDRTLKCDKYNIIQNLLIEGNDIKNIKNNTGFSQSLIYKVKRDLKV